MKYLAGDELFYIEKVPIPGMEINNLSVEVYIASSAAYDRRSTNGYIYISVNNSDPWRVKKDDIFESYDDAYSEAEKRNNDIIASYVVSIVSEKIEKLKTNIGISIQEELNKLL